MNDPTDNARTRMIDDLGRHAASQMQDVLNRNMRVIETALDPAECMIVLLNIANGVAMGAALYGMQLSKEDREPGWVLQLTADTLPKLFAAGRPLLLAEFAKRGRAGSDG